jgi:hypothetical protein
MHNLRVETTGGGVDEAIRSIMASTINDPEEESTLALVEALKEDGAEAEPVGRRTRRSRT